MLAEVNGIVAKPKDKPAGQRKILKQLGAIGLAKSDESRYLVPRQNRGAPFMAAPGRGRPKWWPGRGDWIPGSAALRALLEGNNFPDASEHPTARAGGLWPRAALGGARSLTFASLGDLLGEQLLARDDSSCEDFENPGMQASAEGLADVGRGVLTNGNDLGLLDRCLSP